jgi:hypothetical protein
VVETLKLLKKQSNEEYSSNAANLINKWRNKLNEATSSTTSSLNVTSINKNCTYNKPNEQLSKQSSSSNNLKSLSTISPNEKNEEKNANNKRQSSTGLDKLNNSSTNKKLKSHSSSLSSQSIADNESKSKLSLSDYKLKNSNKLDQNDKNISEEATKSENKSKIDYFKIERSNIEDESKIESLQKTTKSRNSSKIDESNSQLKSSTTKFPPLPSMSLSELFKENPLASAKHSAFISTGSTSTNPFGTTRTSASLIQEKPNINRMCSDDEALSRIFSAKHSKRVLYTGRKPNVNNGTNQVDKLYDLCVQTLINSLDDLHHRVAIYSIIFLLFVVFFYLFI